IEKGEFCCIVGTSGSGKSTLLNMLAGLEKPTKGQIVIAGEHIESKNESQLVNFRQAHVGFIFQSYNLMQNMTAIENVAMPLTFQGVSKWERERRAIKMLKLVGLGKYMRHRPGEMSGGQQQRVGIARALVVNPEIVFADEPTGNLDSNTTIEVLQLIKKISQEKNQTMVMVTHDNYLAGFGDRIIQIRDGKIIRNVDNREQARLQMEALLNGTASAPEASPQAENTAAAQTPENTAVVQTADVTPPAADTQNRPGSIWDEVNETIKNGGDIQS
ncbi:MAG: ABC transporter ATP-binding protein, partial [Lachnospiraceae bacterium]|nr:ABC transporter ATP-binding protein [Lachnospiraceae bacterium]